MSMPLEDHLGDVVRKARKSMQAELGAVARAAGCPEADWTALESAGKTDRPITWAAVAPLLGLQAEKLRQLAEGWTPQPVDLSTWRELRVVSTTRGGNTVNCYLAWDEVSREAALFDTGW